MTPNACHPERSEGSRVGKKPTFSPEILRGLPLRMTVSVMLTMTVVLMLVTDAGCKHHDDKHRKPLPTSAPAPEIESFHETLQPPPAPHLPVKQGQLPLAYIVESGGNIVVSDAESGGVLAQGIAGPR